MWTFFVITFSSSLLGILVTAKFTALSETNFKAGDYFRTLTHGHVFAVDEKTVVYGLVESWTATTTTIVGKSKNSQWAQKTFAKKRDIDNSYSYNNFDPAVGAALAKRLIGKELPYNRNTCNKYTYRRFFLHGKAVWYSFWYQCSHGGLSADCPLAQDLHGLTVADVEDPNFVLFVISCDIRNNPYKVSNFRPYPKYEKYYGTWKDWTDGMEINSLRTGT